MAPWTGDPGPLRENGLSGWRVVVFNTGTTFDATLSYVVAVCAKVS